MSFSEAHTLLLAAVKTNGRLQSGKAVKSCVHVYDGTDIKALEKQVQCVASAIWSNPIHVLSNVLHDTLSPYINLPKLFPPTQDLLDHPDVIRTCLAMAQFIDDERITMNEYDLNAQLKFLVSLPGFTNPENTESLLLPRTGDTLMGAQWYAMCTLYDLPLEGASEFRKALSAVPTSLFKCAQPTPCSESALPSNLLP